MAQARKPKFAVGQVVAYGEHTYQAVESVRTFYESFEYELEYSWMPESVLRELTHREKEGIRARQPKRRRK